MNVSMNAPLVKDISKVLNDHYPTKPSVLLISFI